MPPCFLWSYLGSPPHVRGKALCLPCLLPKHRITPACAGKSTKLRNAIRSKWDHPRMCGEKSAASTCPICARGSPPHVRGKVKENQTLWYEDRITPACAGKSYIRLALLHPTWDHPRMCGEKQLVAELPKTSLGSPPHVRGKVDLVAVFISRFGITPACAGKSVIWENVPGAFRDHPRMCGEKTKKIP